MIQSKTIVIGGGAAGLMAAGRAAERGSKVILLEKMAKTGRKIGISGKGRCNLTNNAELIEFMNHFGKNGRFLRQCFQQFFTSELLDFFTTHGLPLTLERGGRYFPESGRALDVVRVFNNWLKQLHVQTRENSPVTRILVKDGGVCGILCQDKKYSCDNVIIATGGKSYPRTGSTGDGYQILRELGHTITPLRPALVPIKSNHPSLGKLAGLELRNVQVRVFVDKKKKTQEFGELSFTSSGLSGPTALTLSGLIIEALSTKKRVQLALDLKPALDEKKLDARLIRDLQSRRGESIESILRGILPKQLIEVCLVECKIPKDIDTTQFPGKTRKKLVSWLKDFRFDITGHRSWDEAIVTAGGVSLKEIDPVTMESKLIKRLFIAGELLDIQADTGGYNLQAAFSTGWVAGNSIYSD
ncbi:MAG: NAD(P)/FAD-dependent oxidoreductase [Desulfobulbaceae bacterium]|nr:NAD(P)/FAD-dependent oxidoreductase [Desulfobulbaceae bacterium]